MCKILRVLKRGVVLGMGKEKLSEEDIKARYITPAVEQSGWDKSRFVMSMHSQQVTSS